MIDIYGTLGPACGSEETLKQMFSLGMTGMRLNLSHGTLESAAGRIDCMHRAAEACGMEPKLLIDLQGPELRTGEVAEPVFLKEGEYIEFCEKGISVPKEAIPYLVCGQEILLDDGKLLVRAEDQNRALVIRGGYLKSRKSLALPGAKIHPPTLTDMDRKNLSAAKRYGVTGVMQPFVRDRSDLEEVRRALFDAGCGEIQIFAKIENMEGASRIEELLPAADAIVIARGDLGNAVPLWELPALQKKLAEKCREAKKPFMVVTQMLASMEKSPVPTRAEVSDIFNAVLDGASSVMVTGETAVGQYPKEVIRYLAKTAESAVRYRAAETEESAVLHRAAETEESAVLHRAAETEETAARQNQEKSGPEFG